MSYSSTPNDEDENRATNAECVVEQARLIKWHNTMRGSRGGTGGPDPLKNHKNIGFLSNTGPNP